jgi:peptidoglycan/LPS O-acetylase OafA/YrhL
MKHLFFLVALLLASRLGSAQTLGSAARPDTLAMGPATPALDTVAALHRLFAAKRKKRLPIVAGTIAADALGIAVVGATVDSGGWVDDRALGQALVGVLGVIMVGTEVLFYTAAYSRKKEERAVAAYEAHQLPRHLKRQLKARYFQDLPPVAHPQRLAGRAK